MSITLKISCDGCHTETESKDVRVKIERLYGNWVKRHIPSIKESMPEGWVSFDPYTGCTYCKKCWSEIIKEKSSE